MKPFYSTTQTQFMPRYIAKNKRTTISNITINDNGFLSDKEMELFNLIQLKHNNLLVAPVGYGKTTFTIKTCLKFKTSIIIAPTTNLKNQIFADAQKYIKNNNLKNQIENNIHFIKMFIDDHIIYISTYQDLINHPDFLNQVDLICIDECHWIFEYASFVPLLAQQLSNLICNLTGQTTFLLISATPNAFTMFPEELYIENIIHCYVNKLKLEPQNICLHSSNKIISSVAIYENFYNINPLTSPKGIIVSNKETCKIVEFNIEALSRANLGLGYRGCNVAPQTIYNSLKTTINNLEFISSTTQHNSTIVQSIVENTSEQINTNFLATSVFSVGLNLTNPNYTDLMVASNSFSFIQQATGRVRFKLTNLHLLNVVPYTNPNYKFPSQFELKAELYKILLNLTGVWNPFTIVSNWWYLYEQQLYCNLPQNLTQIFPNANIIEYTTNNLPTTNKNHKQINNFFNLKLKKVSFKRAWQVLTSGNYEYSVINNMCATLGINFGECGKTQKSTGHKKLITVVSVENQTLTPQLLKQIIERNIQNENIKIQLTE